MSEDEPHTDSPGEDMLDAKRSSTRFAGLPRIAEQAVFPLFPPEPVPCELAAWPPDGSSMPKEQGLPRRRTEGLCRLNRLFRAPDDLAGITEAPDQASSPSVVIVSYVFM